MARVFLKRLPNLKQKLIRLKTQTESRVSIAMEGAATEITEMMKRLASDSNKSGKLVASIGWTWGAPPSGSISFGHSVGSKRITIYAGGPEAFYARWIEFGTAPHALAQGSRRASGKKQDEGKHHPGTMAQPFFFNSYRALKKKSKLMMQKAIRQAIKEVART